MPPPDPTRFDDHSSFLGTFADELIVRARKMDSLVGARHWGTVGRFLENLIADAVRNITPAGFGVSSGFTLVPRGEADDSNQVSREQDLIVFDERYFAPFHRDSGTALVHPSTVAATVQVKRTLAGC